MDLWGLVLVSGARCTSSNGASLSRAVEWCGVASCRTTTKLLATTSVREVRVMKLLPFRPRLAHSMPRRSPNAVNATEAAA